MNVMSPNVLESAAPKSASLPICVLITPARNEAPFIKKTMESVIRQTALPARWVIVNDGSTDETGDIVARCAEVFLDRAD